MDELFEDRFEQIHDNEDERFFDKEFTKNLWELINSNHVEIGINVSGNIVLWTTEEDCAEK